MTKQLLRGSLSLTDMIGSPPAEISIWIKMIPSLKKVPLMRTCMEVQLASLTMARPYPKWTHGEHRTLDQPERPSLLTAESGTYISLRHLSAVKIRKCSIRKSLMKKDSPSVSVRDMTFLGLKS
jgi:hypothetical protein